MFRMVLRSAGSTNAFYEDTNTDETLKVLEPKLELQENAAGKLSFNVPPTNALYSSFGFVDGDNADNNTIDTWVDVYKENQMYWCGRIISRRVDFWKCVKVECEGLLAVLNDTIQPPYHYQNITPRTMLESLLNVHNSRVNDNNRRIYLGNVTVGTSALGSTHRYTNYETTLTCIIEKLVKNVGGRIKLRYDNYTSRWYLDYLADYDELNSQKIEFGRNLFEYSRSMTSADYCTVVIPRGKQLETGPYEALTNYLTVASVNGGDIHVSLTAADYGGTVPGGRLPQEIYGNIEKVVDWNDIESASVLLSTAKSWLKDKQFADMQLEVGAMDLHYAGAQYQVIEIGNTVRVLSPPHGMDRIFPVTKMEIKLDTPEDTLFTLGDTASVSMTARSSNASAAIQNQFANIPTEQRLTTVFRQEATDLINHAITGYINIIQNEETGAQELVFSKTPNYKESVGIWRWTYNGLGWKPSLYDDDNVYTIAITNDGRINADFISTGTLVADIIRAGILTDQRQEHNFWFNIATGEYHIRALDDLIEDSQYYVTLTQLSQTAASIEASAAATYATIDTANGLATRLATAESNISINATSIQSKVSLTDYTGATIASKINQSAMSVVIQANHISLAGKTIALTSDNIAISSTNFSVTKDGTITAKAGTIGGFTIDATSIHTDSSSSTADGAIYLSTTSFTRSIGGTNRQYLRFAIGAHFAVSTSGLLYASNANIKGTVNATTLISNNAQITGGYFTVDASNSSENKIIIKYGNYTSNLAPTSLQFKTSGGGYGYYSANLLYLSNLDNPTTSNQRRFLAQGDGTVWIKRSTGASIFETNGTNIIHAVNAYGNLAFTGLTAANSAASTAKTVSSGTVTNIISLAVPSAGVWVISAGARFGSNSVGRRAAILSRSSASWSEDDYGNQFVVPAVDGDWTEGSICKIYTAAAGDTFYLNAYQNSGTPLTVYAAIRMVRIS